MTKHQLDIDENQHAIMILRKLDCMRRDQKNCDLVICAEGKEIHVNRDVMCAGSDYFDAMFSHNTKEKQEGVVDMKDVEFAAVEKCVDFIYSGKISVSEEDCEELLYSARLMQLNEVCEKISSFLEDHVTLKSFFNIRRIAIKFSLNALNALCNNFALMNFFRLAKEEEFSNVDIELVSFLLSFKKFSGKRIEDSKLFFALEWVKADANNREKYLMNLVEIMDTTKLTPGYTRYLVENEPLCLKFPEFMVEISIKNANLSLVGMTGPPNLSEISLAADIIPPNSLVLFDKLSKVVRLYWPSENKLTRVAAYCDDMDFDFTACMLREYVYVLNRRKKAFRLNINKSNPTWIPIADMLKGHGFCLQCTVHENYIYVGGNNKMERYKVGESEKWEVVDLDGNISNCSALVGFKEFVFVIGGNKGEIVNEVRKFSPSSSSWMVVQSMNVRRSLPSATVFDDKIYVAGGSKSGWLCDFEMYDGISDLWTILPKMNSPRCFFRLRVVDDQIFAIGSNNDDCSIEVYDSWNARWIPHHDGPTMEIWAPATLATYSQKK